MKQFIKTNNYYEQDTAEKKQRDFRIDIIRIVAAFSVLGVHFFLHSGYYDIPLTGRRMYVATLLRILFGVCVPLFMIISGYLQNHKRLEKGYFFEVFKFIGAYALVFGAEQTDVSDLGR